MTHNHSWGKKHQKKKKLSKKGIEARKLVLEPSTPKTTVVAAPSTHEAAAPELALPNTPMTPPASKATTTVASKVKALRSAVLKTMTPTSRKSAGVAGSPSPSPLRWVSYPIRRGGNVKAVLFSSKDDSPPKILLNTPVNTKIVSDNIGADADSPSPAKPRALAVDILAMTTPSAADTVNMGSPPAPVGANQQSADAESSEKDAKAKRRGHAAALEFIRTAGDSVASSSASLKRGVTKSASSTWSGIKRAATCACFKTSATKA